MIKTNVFQKHSDDIVTPLRQIEGCGYVDWIVRVQYITVYHDKLFETFCRVCHHEGSYESQGRHNIIQNRETET